MNFRYTLPPEHISRAADFAEFGNGGAQFSVRLNDGSTWHGLLLSGSEHIIAMRGHADLPFAVEEIEEVFQTEEDKAPAETSGWCFWDDWS